MEIAINTTKFTKLNKNLKNYIFEYLDLLERIKLFFLNKSIQKILNLDLQKVKILLYLHSLKNNGKSTEFYLNSYKYKYLLSMIVQKFYDVPYKKLMEIICYYLRAYNQVYSFEKILVDFSQPNEISILKELVKHLDKEKFTYVIKINGYRNKFNMDDLVSILKNIKYASIQTLRIDFLRILIDNNIELYFKYRFDCFTSNFESYEEYFTKYNNHLEFLNFNYYSSEKNTKLLKLNHKSLKTFDYFVELENEKEVLQNFEFEKLETINMPPKLRIQTPDYFSRPHAIFRQVKILKGLMISAFNKHLIINFMKSLESLEELKIHLLERISFTELQLTNLHKLECDMYTIDDFSFAEIIVSFPNLSEFSLTQLKILGDKKFKFGNVFSFENFDTTLPLDLILKLILNTNTRNEEKIGIKSNDYNLIVAFFNFLDDNFNTTNNIDYLLSKVSNFSIEDETIPSRMFNRKVSPALLDFKTLRWLEVKNLNSIVFLKSICTLDNIVIKNIEKNNKILNNLLDKNLKGIMVEVDDKMSLLKFIKKNKFHFASLRYINITRSEYILEECFQILEEVLSLNLFFLGITVIVSNSKLRSKVRDLKRINGIKVKYISKNNRFYTFCDK